MDKNKASRIISIGTVLVIMFLFMLWYLKHEPGPEPTVTPTLTSTMAPIFPTLTPTNTATSTSTPENTQTPTIQPTETPIVLTPGVNETATPVPQMVMVSTGYQPGWLHFRECAGLRCRAQWWGFGAVQEGELLEYVGCALAPFPWMKVIYQGRQGFVYSVYVVPNYCLGSLP